MKLNFGQNSFLFMGDAESQVENQLSNIKSDVLKVGHHGSNSSSGLNFLKKVDPQYSIISVGGKNSYGHPTQNTLDTLNSIGCEIYRTDLFKYCKFQQIKSPCSAIAARAFLLVHHRGFEPRTH